MKKAAREIDQGREAYARKAWAEAYRFFALADEAAPLPAEDLERLAWAAALSGQDDAMIRLLDRLYQLHVRAGSNLAAVRSAFWLCMRLFSRGEAGQASGWLARAQRLVEQEGGECAERGYLLLPAHPTESRVR